MSDVTEAPQRKGLVKVTSPLWTYFPYDDVPERNLETLNKVVDALEENAQNHHYWALDMSRKDTYLRERQEKKNNLIMDTISELIVLITSIILTLFLLKFSTTSVILTHIYLFIFTARLCIKRANLEN
jgi:hypothetical protein